MKRSELDTPCLVVDLDIMERNIAKMAAIARDAGVVLRPMTKTHKCPEISRLQVDAGATPGIQTAKVGEAEVMAKAGIQDIFISNEIIGDSKVERMAELSRRGTISTSVDSEVGARGLDRIGREQGVTFNVLIHVDSGNRRSGVLPGKPTLELARKIVKLDNVNLKGIWTHEGHNYAGKNPKEVLKITMKAARDMVNTKKLIEKELKTEIYNSMGSTPGAEPLATVEGVDEIRPGAYIFYDMSQVEMQACGIEDCAIAVLTTVISTPTPKRMVCDTGSKAYYPPGEWLAVTDDGCAINWPLPPTAGGALRRPGGPIEKDLVFHRWGEEVGMINIYGKKGRFKIGDKVEIIPYHCCSTVNLHDELYGVRNDELEVTWPVAARGKFR